MVLRNILNNSAWDQLLECVNQQFAELSCSSTCLFEFKNLCNIGFASINVRDIVFEQGSTVCT